MKRYDTILFDLDGTLTEPKEGITKALQYALDKFGITIENRDELVKFIGPPLLDTFVQHYSFDEPQAWQAIHFYREYFSQQGIFENEVYPGIAELLAGLKERDHKILLATSKPTVFSERILEHFGLKNYFDFVVGSTLDGSRIEKKDIISYALGLLEEKKPIAAVMVGDRKHDIIGARLNGIDSIAVTYGYGSPEELEAEKPTYLINTIPDLTCFLLK